jgi:hypothetical protein
MITLRSGIAAGGLGLGDLVEDGQVVAGEEGPTVDDHVDLVGTGRHSVLGVEQFDRHRGAATGEGGGDGGDLDPRVAQDLLGGGDHVAVDADRGRAGGGEVARVGGEGLGGQAAHSAVGVGPLERGQVDHRDGQVDRPALAVVLDRARAQSRGAGLAPHLVDPR